MERRTFLKKFTVAKPASPIPVAPLPPNGTLTPYTGTWDVQTVGHLLRRVMFGAKKEDVDYFLTKTLEEKTVDELLTVNVDPPPYPPDNYFTEEFYVPFSNDLKNGIVPDWLDVNPSPPVNDYSYIAGETFDDTEVPKGLPWVASSPNFGIYDGVNDYSGNHCNYRRFRSFNAWWGKLIIEQERSILEKMTLFWHNHFAMRALNDGQHYKKPAIYWNNALIRYYSLGNFRQFIKYITIDPLMLGMLNGSVNTKNSINENYAREVQELFLLGLVENAPDSYTDDDIAEAARIFTGWQGKAFIYENNDGVYVYGGYREAILNEVLHDTGDKTFSSFYNNTVINGVAGPDGGEQEIDAFFDMVFDIRGQEVAKHICREIYRFFVSPRFAYQPAANNNSEADIYIETNIIEPLAQIFIDNNFEVKHVMETLLKSEHFFDDCNKGAIIKSPIDFLAGIAREFSIFPTTFYVNNEQINDINVAKQAYIGWMYSWGQLLGQRFFNIPAVTGWPAYHQAPYDEAWLNGATYARRIRFIDNALNPFGNNHGWNVIGSNGFVDEENYYWRAAEVDLIGFTQKFTTPADPNALVAEVCEYFFPLPIHETVQSQLKSNLLGSSTAGDYTWTELWGLGTAPNATEEDINTLKLRLRTFYKTLCKVEEYHIM